MRYEQHWPAAVWNYYRDFGRHDLPWRQPEASGDFDPYKILVSELMLQQTQVSRVIPKYEQFIGRFPDVNSLAHAPLSAVLQAWSGLGYNRRAKFLHQIAKQIQNTFPQTTVELQQLPGIGPNTAAAIMVYAFNQPQAFIETNIRTVYLHHFFHDQTNVTDKQILEIVDQTMDQSNPREWCWALMDYGVHLKQTIGNQNHRSTSYTKQSKFEGSRRQIRGQVIRLLGTRSYSLKELRQALPDQRLTTVLDSLVAEGMIQSTNSGFHL